MQVLKSLSPVIMELSYEDITILHLSLYQFKDWLKHTDKINKLKKRKRMQEVSRMITLVDLLL